MSDAIKSQADTHGHDAHGDDHGNTPAAWTAVIIALASFVVGGIGLMADSIDVFWIGVALTPIAIVVYVIMSKMGLGNQK